jgi:hypothetical protein
MKKIMEDRNKNSDDLAKSKISPPLAGGEDGEGDK